MKAEHEEVLVERQSLRLQNATLKDELWQKNNKLEKAETDLAIQR